MKNFLLIAALTMYSTLSLADVISSSRFQGSCLKCNTDVMSAEITVVNRQVTLKTCAGKDTDCKTVFIPEPRLVESSQNLIAQSYSGYKLTDTIALSVEGGQVNGTVPQRYVLLINYSWDTHIYQDAIVLSPVTEPTL